MKWLYWNRNKLCMTFSWIYFVSPCFSMFLHHCGSHPCSLFFLQAVWVCISGLAMHEKPKAYFYTQCLSPGMWLRVDYWHIKAGWGGFCSHWASANSRQRRRMRAKCVLALQTEQEKTWSLPFSSILPKIASSSVLLGPEDSLYLRLHLVSCFRWFRNKTLTPGRTVARW